MRILSLGDCNTLGTNPGQAYPELLAQKVSADVKNCGCTMSCMQEAAYFFRDYYTHKTDLLTIHYGLVDSWETFKYAPYVLYYPDHWARKIARKMIKKYKKCCRKMGLNKWLGSAPVVRLELYQEKIVQLISKCHPHTKIMLIETLPNLDNQRNKAIEKYNTVLKKLADTYAQCACIHVYDHFKAHPELYLDETHINDAGHAYIAESVINAMREDKDEFDNR